MSRKSDCSVLLVLLVLAWPGLAATALAASLGPDRASFQGAWLGMTMDDWRALPIAPGAGPAPERSCSSQYRIVEIPGYALSAEEKKTGVVACAYVSRFGHQVLAHTVQLDPAFRVSRLVYLFRRGRLFEIRFDASIDAYSDLEAMFTKRYGPPTGGVDGGPPRSSARARPTWRAPDGTIVVEPADNPTLLRVRFIANRQARG